MSTQNNSANPGAEEKNLGLAGKMTKAFINSPLTPMFFVACLVVGLIGLQFTPRQEDPQISVPMFDIFVQYPGASATQVANTAISPLERAISDIPGVKHVYSASEKGRGMVTVQFKVGESEELSRTKLKAKLDSNMGSIPPGVHPPLVQAKGVNSVPVVTLTLWSEKLSDALLRKIGLEVQKELKIVPNTSESFITGGRRENIRVEVLPEKLAGFGISLAQIADAIKKKNVRMNFGKIESGGQSLSVEAGQFIRGAEDLKGLQISSRPGQVVYLRDVANVIEGPEETSTIVRYSTGPAGSQEGLVKTDGAAAVTVAIAKKKGSNGIDVAAAVLARVEKLKELNIITDQVNVAVTRNYGETAKQKVNALIGKLFIATGIVVFLIWAALGFLWQPAFVVALVIPIVILVTVFSALIMGFTIDRVSLFALIFSIGILVDDAIVVVENIYRNWLLKNSMDDDVTIEAVAEVGNPTILATFTVVAALMPMGFVSGMMGPYMSPIPALGSVAMIFSLFAAFIFTPWLVVRFKPSKEQLEKMEEKEHRQMGALTSLFHKTLGPLLDSPYKARIFKLSIWAVFLISCSLFYFKAVTVKMLPLDNKPEFNIVVNMSDGTALPVTANAIQVMTEELLKVKEVTAVQSYAGTASPFNFNGLVRHYYLRSQPWQGDIQVQLLDKSKRDRTSNEIAVDVRKILTPVAARVGAKIQVVEMPPGPPVLQTMVAEVYGPDDATRRQVARDLTDVFEKAESVVDVDNYMTDPHYTWIFKPNMRKAEREGVTAQGLAGQMAMLMGGFKVGDAKQGRELEPRYIVMQAPLAVRGDIGRLLELPIMTSSGRTIPLGQLGKFEKVLQEQVIYRKDMRAVEYVTGEVTGSFAAPVYGQVEVGKLLANYKAPDGVELYGSWLGLPYGTLLGLPANSNQSAFEWGGEWTVTFETFRDMGAAFMAAMVLIYALVVWEFGNFRLPSIIMAPIPLTLIGIIPFHGLLGKEFTATSMIGWIALAGIIVRNSILLVDFAKHEIQAGVDKRDAVMNAVIARTRPIMVTALALVGGSFVIYSDPIFNGMAISLMAGVMVSTILTLYVIPMAAAVAHGAYDEELPEEYADQMAARAEAAKLARENGDTAGAKVKSGIGSVFAPLWAGFMWIWGRPPAHAASGTSSAAAVSSAGTKTSGEQTLGILGTILFYIKAILTLLWMGFKWIWGAPEAKPVKRSTEHYGTASASKSEVQDAISRLNDAVKKGGKDKGSQADPGAQVVAKRVSSSPAKTSEVTAGNDGDVSDKSSGADADAKTEAEGSTDTSVKSVSDKSAEDEKKAEQVDSSEPAEDTTRSAQDDKSEDKAADEVEHKASGKTATSTKDSEKFSKGEMKDASADEDSDEAADDADKGKTTKKSADKSAKKPVAKKPAAKKPAAKSEEKTSAKAVAKSSAVDDTQITLISGIGPAMSKVLDKIGFGTLTSIANMNSDEVEKVETEIGFGGRIAREKWIEQARDILASDSEKEKTQTSKKGVKKAGKSAKKVKSDDITLIAGIGPGIAKKLNALGFTTLEQIASLSKKDLEKIDAVMTFKGCAVREKWSEQAQNILSGK